MRLLNFTIIKLTTCLVLGILIAFFIKIPTALSLHASSVLILITSILYLHLKLKKTNSIWFGCFSLLTMISIGVLTTNFHEEKRHDDHYLNYTSTSEQITFRIKSTLKPGKYNNKYIVDVLKIDSTNVSGKALLNVSRDSLNSTFKVDEIFITSKKFQNITGVINPYQFNYKSYLAKQYVYQQLYVNPKRLFRVSDNKHTIYGYADTFRNHINNKLQNYDFENDVLAIINALILGQRQGLSKDIYNNYTDAGAVHILAVSGLHVALILYLLTIFFKPLKRLKHGKIATIICLVIIMWCFAIIAGLTASVTRAVTMFSIIAIGMHLKRPTNIYNTLAISIFILLLFRPLFLFDVGFQLSYLAVIAIVAIQPRLKKLWQPKNYILNKIWDFGTVGVAAQCGVLPISLYYFHQFPGLFFVANIVIIPFLGIILGIGILVIILALLNILPQFLVDVFSGIISAMNKLMEWLALQESFLFKDISFSAIKVIAAYLLIVAIVQFAIKQNSRRLQIALVAVLVLQATYFTTKYYNSSNELTVFHKSRFTVVGKKTNKKLEVFSNLDSLNQFYNLNDYKVGYNIKTIYQEKLPSILASNNKLILIIDSLSVYKTMHFKPDYILLTQSPKLNLKRVIDSIKPKVIIADGSNYKSYISRWEQTCRKQKIPFHYTGKKGAFIIK
ncbi:ComEC/Rec2 family competence protein [Lacinutrix sp. 5H-3-7-4]|uniref:ComEC/Rec2 family competence protein n=1 Tax=Lacinutrix sp. (strain 5H-3-7-4) TaxID=983544 RepID=UPI00020A3951|nr:ComEC/Rec2 family competence protein [Lacinutrix sp. 5H-3-7-4]